MTGIQTANGYRNNVKAVYTVPLAEKDAPVYPFVLVLFNKARTFHPEGNPATVFHTDLQFIIQGFVEVKGLMKATDSKLQDDGESLLHDIKRAITTKWISQISGTGNRWMLTDEIEEDRIVFRNQNMGTVGIRAKLRIFAQDTDF